MNSTGAFTLCIKSILLNRSEIIFAKKDTISQRTSSTIFLIEQKAETNIKTPISF